MCCAYFFIMCVAYKLRRVMGARIKEARKLRNRSQKWLAEEVGVTQPSVSDWEKGTSSPSTANLSAIASLLDVNFEWLASGRGPRESIVYAPVEVLVVEPGQQDLDEEEKELLDLFRKLPKSRRSLLMTFVRDWIKLK